MIQMTPHMMIRHSIMFLLLTYASLTVAFSQQPPQPAHSQSQRGYQNPFYTPRNVAFSLSSSSSSSPASSSSSAADPEASATNMSILECDADQVQTMNAALWEILADLSTTTGNHNQKVCVALEQIPPSALAAFCDDFQSILETPRLMAHLPELARVSVSIASSDVCPKQPAVLLETTNATSQQSLDNKEDDPLSMVDEAKCTAALQSFVSRLVIGLEACPYTQTPTLSATGLEKRGITPGPVAYRFSSTSHACAALATFWASVSELLSTPEVEMSTTLLSLPNIGGGITKEDHDRFAAVMELIGRNLCLFRGDGAVGLVYFHPAYDRSQIYPVDQPAFGHLPPHSWLRPMLKHNNQHEAAASLTEDDLYLSNYQRRAPHTMINILRVSQLNAAVGAKSVVDLKLDNGTTEKASGITLYSRNAIRLAQQGRDKLQSDLEAIWEEYQ